MSKKIDRYEHLPHYLPLIGIFSAGLLAFWIFSYDRQFQAGVAVSLAISHVIWGIVHHHIHKDLTWGVVLEYLAVAAFGLSVIFTVIFRG